MLQQFDKNNRLRAMFKKEMKAEQEMDRLVKQSAKLQSNIAAATETIEQQLCDYEKLLNILKQRQTDMETRLALNDAVQQQIAAGHRHHAEMQKHLAAMKDEYDDLMTSVRVLCEATNTYVNAKKLPGQIIGFSGCDNGNKLIQFKIDSNDKDAISLLCEKITTNSVHADAWRDLFTRRTDVDDKENIVVGNASIIEIDLTASLSQN